MICLSLMMIIPQAALAASLPMDMAELQEPTEMSIDDAKNGIVRVIAGTVDDNGKFTKKSTATGFIVSNTGNGVFIITSMQAVDFGEKGKIQIVIKNDSTVDAEIEQPYKEKGFCLLSAENKFNDRGEVALRVPLLDDEKNKLSAGDEITALGFPLSLTDSSEFDASDVSEQKGNIIKLAADNSGYMEYGASIPEGFDGGVLVDQDGYAVGLIKEGSNKALDITEIDAALYKENITYQSKDKNLMYAELYSLCADAENLYKKAEGNTKNEIVRTRQDAMDVLKNRPQDRDALRSALDDFNGVVHGGKWKMPKPLLLIIVLGAVIAFLLIRLIMLIIWNKTNDPNGEFSEKRKSKVGMDRKKKLGLRNKKVSQGDGTALSSGKLTGRSAATLAGRREAPSPARLTILRTGMMFTIDSDMITMGKSQDSDISIPDNNRISRQHAVVAFSNGQYYLYDQGSTNGTFLNNMPVDTNGIRLISGDIIRLANEDIQFIQQ